MVSLLRDIGYAKSDIISAVMARFAVTSDKASAVVEKYWNYKPKTSD